ncbi:MAG: hypothetical protein FWE33_05300 [Defluviitaleaceae bacterium]|nr:hypothetical protein [Defluviitaleaceae bacterium]
MKRKILFAIIVAAVLLVFGACSNDTQIAYDDRSIEINAVNFSDTFEGVFTISTNDLVRVECGRTSGSSQIIVTDDDGAIVFREFNL